CPECRVERGAFDVLDRLLAWPGKSLGAQLGGRLAVERLLDPGLLLALEQRMVLERIAGQVRVERHRVGETCVSSLQIEGLPDRLREQRLVVDGHGLFEFRHHFFEIWHGLARRASLADGTVAFVEEETRACARMGAVPRLLRRVRPLGVAMVLYE